MMDDFNGKGADWPPILKLIRLLSIFRDAAMIRQNQSSLVAQSDPNLDQEMM